jgi:hypothetical protein
MISKPCFIHSPPNTPLELTPLRVEQDRVDFERQIWLDSFPMRAVRRSAAAGRSAAQGATSPAINDAQDRTHMPREEREWYG